MAKVSVQIVVTFLVCSLQVWQTSGQDNSGKYHFNLMVENVKAIAAELATIYETQCGPRDCPCSQDMCQPQPEDSNPSCLNKQIPTSDLYNCSNFLEEKLGERATLCPSIKVTTSRSSVTYKRSTLNTPITAAQRSTICRTQQIDTVFARVSNQTEIYTEYFMGMVDGTHRSYPGREEDGKCVDYDCRKRPWFTGGISYPNYLVILIDCGHSMGKGSTEPGSGKVRLDDARSFALELLETLHNDDFVTVLTFGADLDDTYNKSVQVKLNHNSSQLQPERHDLMNKLNSMTPAEEITTVTKFLRGLNTTLRAFQDTTLPDFARVGRLQNVILLTDGSFADMDISKSDSVALVLNRLRSNNVRLFIYGINAGSSAAYLKSLTDKVNGVYENVTDTENLLYNMRSYLGYLALSHRNLYGDTPFWTEDYNVYFGYETIVSVTKLAFTYEDQFIGVAAIHVLVNESTFFKEFTAAVVDQRKQQEETYSTASNNITFPVPAVLDDSSCEYQISNLFCSPSEATPGEPARARKCCNMCGVDQHVDAGDDSEAMGIILGSVFGVAGLVAFGTCGFILWRKRKPKPKAPARVPRTRNGKGSSFVVGETGDGAVGQTWTQPL